MNEHELTPSPVTKQKPKRSILQRILRSLLAAVLVLLLFLVFVIAFTQTPWFRSIVASQLESFIESKTNGILTIDHIDGNFLSGFTIHDAHLSLKKDKTEVASSKELYLRYSLWKLLEGNSIPVTTIELRNPTIQFVRQANDSLWNYEQLVLSNAQPGQPPSHFSMTIDVRHFRIIGGTFIQHDYFTEAHDSAYQKLSTAMDWTDLTAQYINLDMQAHIEGEKIQQAQINHLSFASHDGGNHPFRVYHLDANALRHDLRLEVSSFHLVTDESDIRLSAHIDPFYLMDDKPLSALENSETQLQLTAKSVGERELKQIVPQVSFLEGNPSLNLRATGTFGKLKITKGDLGFGDEGDISFAGEIRNLHDPHRLFLNIGLRGHHLSDRTVKEYVPGLHIEDISRFGTVTIDKLNFTGYPNNFATDIDIHSAAGDAAGKASFDFRGREMIYHATIETKKVNLEHILRDSGYRSSLNSTFKISGNGTNPKTMQTSFELEGTGRTQFKNYDLEKLHIAGKIGGAKLQLENTELALHQGTSLSSTYASIDFSDKAPIYDFDVRTKDFPITDFVSFPKGSKISAEANLSGNGFSANNISGDIRGTVTGLELQGKPTPDVVFNATFERDETPEHARVDVITSPVADLTFKGMYNVETIVPIIAKHAEKVISAIRDRGMIKDSLIEVPADLSCDSLKMAFTADIKDLHPLAPFIPDLLLLGSAKINGQITCEQKKFAVSTDGTIHNFFMRARDRGPSAPLVRIRDTKFSFNAGNISDNEASILQSMTSDLKVSSDSMQRFNELYIEKPVVDLSVKGGDLEYKLNTILAKQLGIDLKGKGNISRPDLTFKPDSLRLTFHKDFEWRSIRNPDITISRDGTIEIDTLELIKPKVGYDPQNVFAQRIRVGLKMKEDSIMYAYLESPQLELSDIPKFLPNPDAVPELSNMTGRISSLQAHLSGTMYDPVFWSDITFRNVNYHEVTIDTGRINLRYQNLTLSGGAAFHVDTAAFAIESERQELEHIAVGGKNSFRLYIDSIPMQFALKRDIHYTSDSLLVVHRQMSIRAVGNDYPLDMFGPFIQPIARLHGLSEIELAITGTRQTIVYSGEVSIGHGSFLFPATNMEYNFNGKLLLSLGKMELNDIHLTNIPADDPNGSGLVNGYFNFQGFEIKDFSLSLTTDRLKVLSDASKETMKNMYGPLVIRTEGTPIVFSGTLNRPKVEGHIAVLDGNLTIPQTEATSETMLNDGISYRIKKEEVLKDTNKRPLQDTLRHLVNTIAGIQDTVENKDTVFEREMGAITPSGTAAEDLTPAEMKFQEKLLYDLVITVPGDLWFNLKLNKAMGLVTQEVNAEVKPAGNILIERSEPGDKLRMNATIDLMDRSTYKFIKEFSPVTGTLTFINDLENPTLDVTAEYTGLHKTPSGADESIRIKIIVRGTKNDPLLSFELYHKGAQGDYIKDSRPNDLVQNDVLSYLATGLFASDVPGQGAGTSANLGLTAAYQLGSAEANNLLQYLGLNSVIKSFGAERTSQYSKYKLTFSYKNLLITPSVSTINQIGSTPGYLTTDIYFEVPFSSFTSKSPFSNFRFTGNIHPANSADPTSQEGLAQPPLFLGKLLYPF